MMRRLIRVCDNAASHLGLRCLPTGISVKNILNIEINILDIPNFGNKLIQSKRTGESSRLKCVKKCGAFQRFHLILLYGQDAVGHVHNFYNSIHSTTNN